MSECVCGHLASAHDGWLDECMRLDCPCGGFNPHTEVATKRDIEELAESMKTPPIIETSMERKGRL